MKYEIPLEYFFRIHHIRPRFKNDVENVLYYIANELVRIPKQNKDEFIKNVNNAIKLYPGNLDKEDKTINNWRTEISSLFGLISTTEDGQLEASEMARVLATQEDLIEFFRYFLFYFQYPGGHLKVQEIAEYIQVGIKFKPAHYFLNLLLKGEQVTSKRFGIDKAEATHCVFNDLRVTRDKRSIDDVVDLILRNRAQQLEYDWTGDVIRYAGDILDYLVLANLVILNPDGKYYLNHLSDDVIKSFLEKSTFFNAYDLFYNRSEIDYSQINKESSRWFKYINTSLSADLFRTDLSTYLDDTTTNTPVMQLLNEVIKEISHDDNARTKKIGDTGEAIVYRHEKQKLLNKGLNQLVQYVQKIPSHFAVGYDIQSAEFDGKRKYIEVKTTVSRNKITINKFHLTPSEWSCADTQNDRYFVYRLSISKEAVELFVIQNPVGLYKQGLVKMILRDGAEIQYNNQSGVWEELCLEK